MFGLLAVAACVLNGAVRAFDLTIGPRALRLLQAMLNTVCVAGHVEALRPRIDCVPGPGLIGELGTVICQDRVDAVGNGFEQMLEEFPRCFAIGIADESSNSVFAGPINCGEEIELVLSGLNLSGVQVEATDRTSLEPLPLWFFHWLRLYLRHASAVGTPASRPLIIRIIWAFVKHSFASVCPSKSWATSTLQCGEFRRASQDQTPKVWPIPLARNTV
jgi:hypothetical protein